ncbi:MAG: porin family protein [Candidatus Omnitrophica bacterium]|nr:porin family protein [Candidatus Omnitrophota bacterium]
MKKIIMILFLLMFGLPLAAQAATVRSPEIGLPEESWLLKEDAVNSTLDRFEANINVKGSFDIEFLFNKKFDTTSEVTNAEMDGQNYMWTVSNNFSDVIEPYMKLGTSNLEVTWDTAGNSIVVESGSGFTWAAGVKATVLDRGIKLSLDAQFKETDLDVDKMSLNGSTTNLTNDTFKIKELQVSLTGSKKLILPVGLKDYYIVPYGGVTFSSVNADVSFEDTTGGTPYALYSLYEAESDSPFGVVLGCDVMPSLLSHYLLNFELHLLNETALSLGGTIKF